MSKYRVNGLEVESPLTEPEFKLQVGELFQDEHYQKGKIKKDMVIVDCGANMGLASLYFKDNAKKIYALEPSRAHYEALVKNVSAYPHIKPLNYGISFKDGKDLLINGEGNIPESVYGSGQNKELCDFKSFPSFMADQGIDHIDLLKIDVEGAEYAIFSSPSFAEVVGKIDAIIGEAHYVEGFIPEFVRVILEDYGFEFEWQPYENVYKKMNFLGGKEYTVKFKTVFFAGRKNG